jgi:hypothetical protein
MPYKVQNRKGNGKGYIVLSDSRRRELRQAEAARQEAPGEAQRSQGGASGLLLPPVEKWLTVSILCPGARSGHT